MQIIAKGTWLFVVAYVQRLVKIKWQVNRLGSDEDGLGCMREQVSEVKWSKLILVTVCVRVPSELQSQE